MGKITPCSQALYIHCTISKPAARTAGAAAFGTVDVRVMEEVMGNDTKREFSIVITKTQL